MTAEMEMGAVGLIVENNTGLTFDDIWGLSDTL